MRRRDFITLLGGTATAWRFKTAKTLGLEEPSNLLFTADSVIE